MPPTYKPLAAGIAGIPPEIFAAPPQPSIMDYEKQHEALEAQELANRLNAIAVANKEREAADQEALRTALQDQFGGMNPDEVDLDSGMALAQKYAIRAGNIEQTMALEKARRDRRETSAPLTAEEATALSEVTGLSISPGMSRSTANLLVNAQGKAFYGQSLFDNRERREHEDATLLPEGFEPIGAGPTKDDSKKFKTFLAGNERVSGIIDEIEESIVRTGSTAMTGEDYVKQRALVTELALELKSPAFGNLGAALSPSEYELLTARLPILMSTPNKGLGDVLVEAGLGRDPMSALAALRQSLNRNFDIEQSVRNIRRKRATGSVSAEPLTAPGDVGPQSAPPQGGGPGGLPGNPDGTPFTREQFEAWQAKDRK